MAETTSNADKRKREKQQREKTARGLLDRREALGLGIGTLNRSPMAKIRGINSPMGLGPMPQLAEISIARRKAAELGGEGATMGAMNGAARKAGKRREDIFGG